MAVAKVLPVAMEMVTVTMTRSAKVDVPAILTTGLELIIANQVRYQLRLNHKATDHLS